MRIRCATALVLLAAAACGGPSMEKAETTAAVPVKTVTVSPQTFEGVVAASGVVTPAPGADWTITAPAPARIVAITKAEGDRVKPGDVLVRFEIPSLQTDLAARRAEAQQAQARLDNAQANLDRLTTLVAHGVAARKELEDAQRESKDAQAALTQAHSALGSAEVLADRSLVRARFAGVVAKRWHNPGDLVDASASDPILRIIDPARLQVVAAVPVSDLPRIHTGHAATIVLPGQVTTTEAAHVLTRPAAVETGGATAPVRLAFDRPTQLAAGTPVQVRIVAETHQQALTVPAAALVREDDETSVFVVGPDHKAHKRKITVGLADPDAVEVSSGLRPGEHVIVQGQQALPDGASVTVTR
ncbi:MAG TPA: efflux RND transporter periplasmic adaptor subunit [Vicinamibacterales bacterium]|nr:efflux RND transporter periplasmic adaptor subunit [Vicinamibacterales bacterium]